jgi:hypothetical protein
MAILKKIFRFFIFLLMTSIITAVPVFSQPPGGGDQLQQAQGSQMQQQGTQAGGQTQQGAGGRGFGQGQQAGQMQDMIAQRLKQLMGATDDEWTIIGPKVLKVVSLVSSQSRGFQMRSLMGTSNQQGNPNQGGSNQGSSNQGASSQGNFQGRGMMGASTSSDNKALEELQTLAANKDATAAQLKEKISEVRKEKEESKQKQAKAQKELRELLSLRQEAVLVSVGLLD